MKVLLKFEKFSFSSYLRYKLASCTEKFVDFSILCLYLQYAECALPMCEVHHLFKAWHVSALCNVTYWHCTWTYVSLRKWGALSHLHLKQLEQLRQFHLLYFTFTANTGRMLRQQSSFQVYSWSIFLYSYSLIIIILITRICQRKGRSISGRENIKKSGCGLYAERVKIASQNSTSIICRQLHTTKYINKIDLKTHRTRSSLNHVSSKFEEVIFLIVVQPKK